MGEIAKKFCSIFCGIGRIERGKACGYLENGSERSKAGNGETVL